ncbi:MAG: putative 4-hydroxybenzoate polyprenyltransferase [Desulfarculaceae bacterium]|nr:putative 4-hydroxybenzoate polyprenyltransferase [Desulfarculaceae bacterium]
MIKFSHTVFALPFALSAVILAWPRHEVSWLDFLFILTAMVGARSAAMGFNRIADAAIDSKNPRTVGREIPAGILSKKRVAVFVLGFSLVFVLSAAMLSKICLILSVPVLLLLFFYSYTKRFTKYCHMVLGLAISLAPAGAWIAVAGSLSWSVVFLSLALMTYISGFDILYGCQDIDFDRSEGLCSIPVELGVEKAMRLSSFLHILTIVFLFLMQITYGMHPVFYIFLGLITVLLIIEHLLVKPGNLAHIHIAFFHVNSVVSVVLLAGICIEALLK